MSQVGEFYQIEKDDFDWGYAQLIKKAKSGLEFQDLATEQIYCIPEGNQRTIPVNTLILELLGVVNGQFQGVYVLPTYHFFGNDFSGCCNPLYGYQVFLKTDYDKTSNQLETLMHAAKAHYTHPVDLNYDKDEFIRQQLTCILNVNELFEKLTQLGIDNIDKTEVLKKAERKISAENAHF